MTVIKKKIVPPVHLKVLMDGALHENGEFNEFSFPIPNDHAIVHQGDANWGFSDLHCLHISSDVEIDSETRNRAMDKSKKVWADFASEYDIE